MNSATAKPLMDLHILGALSVTEYAAFERHLAECPWCLRLRSAKQLIASEMRRAIPQLEPPGHLRSRIMAEVNRDAIKPPSSSGVAETL